MEILPQVQEALTYIQSIDVAHIKDKLQARRAYYERVTPLAGEQEAVFAVEDHTIGFPDRKINIRIYRPNDKKVLPAVVYFHGGGFYSGSLETHDRPLRQLTNKAGVVIISVDYRLAPEYPFPHGLNDCIDTTEWIMNHAEELGIDGHCIAVAGDSAGGTLATAVAGKLPNILCQVLIYPATDPSLTTPSWKEFAEGPIITLQRMVEVWENYTEDKINAAPIFETDLSGMPDTFIITAEYDPLRDEAFSYANKLKNANVQVTEKLYQKMIHGFFQMGGVIDQGKEAIAAAADFIRYKLVK
jgi:acetyl esterase